MSNINFPVLSLDLEQNQPSRKIIQVGAIVGDLWSGEIHGALDLFRGISEPINPYITQLTGITNRDVRVDGLTLKNIVNSLDVFFKEFKCKTVIVWSDDSQLFCDLDELRLQSNAELVDADILHSKVINISKWYKRYRHKRPPTAKPTDSGLVKALSRVELDFIGKQHCATDDALNLFRLASLLFQQGEKERTKLLNVA